MILILNDPPVVLDMPNAFSECGAARTEIAILDRGSQTETDRTEELDFDVDVFLVEQSVQSGRYQDEAQSGEARDYQC